MYNVVRFYVMAVTLTRGPKTQDHIDVDGPPSVDYTGWWVVKIRSYRCGCDRIVGYAECDFKHIIVVWSERDDEHMLHAAQKLKEQSMNPKIIQYEPQMGQCIEFSVAVMQGLIS